MSISPIHIIGGGMAGTEAAWQLLNKGIPVILHEMRGVKSTNAHQTDGLAEMVCSNSFRSDDMENNAVGLLHEEMRRLGSLMMEAAQVTKVPAGSALAVDREHFSEYVQKKLLAHPLFSLERGEVSSIPPESWGDVIIATGPLTSDALAQAVLKITGVDELQFFDAIAPIIYKETIDFSKAWLQSRYDKGDGADYINLPMSKDQYYEFIDDITDGEKSDYKDWETDIPFFEGCMPIEVMAERGRETLSFGPMKPVGLDNPHTDERPYAVVQLRQDNKLGTLYNMVGFQTKLKYSFQKEIFRKIPGLENAEFARLGGLHRNTFINSPKLLDDQLRLKLMPRLRFAGQITGVEGYVESGAMGLLAGRYLAAQILGKQLSPPPIVTAFGALINHITGGHIEGAGTAKSFQPMNVNFGIMPPLEHKKHEVEGRMVKIKRKDRKPLKSKRALDALACWLDEPE
ncbi:MAG: methylenetetrahydrofolate--tRNA-(uracil(54)-C(5))-methyltransferase (FADH(2)-oxidizing) TrmFO [Kordiimonadaceae bacterium]|jgi:methylenetetrahydrofolate--tRNA-(uracil-5-)-methyltransferase|nr:methylenetetrahydrofolate--tRNA-(uracil(54)-C(5))-methyltransferase (FADH(2)-oxidizing) TrmFO [Kordiimonadaceae bacterium]MBT6467948.1 methylenetetrahydrofolate--tRNA-(uracil(54)-C(5))-methyltransferase (FADH(2)-oxidizing) TrmFO [Kordiimonadaceae bacterium]MBT7605770.1 methylenetetrahydrofolate--tRNA-(uracil(54)-C(5))-methyltransferase (FADH(2)-oxidizing) TrmFO [Kordiimonadaceae bacterium]MDC0082225.1 methylenetetrahydrofolate--tRNA-(uracil(54)-C(5))-methyltransferase (FADH(2)-oxidizing) TrmF